MRIISSTLPVHPLFGGAGNGFGSPFQSIFVVVAVADADVVFAATAAAAVPGGEVVVVAPVAAAADAAPTQRGQAKYS